MSRSVRRRWCEALQELCERQKSRLLFMTRDVSETVIVRVIDLLELLRGEDARRISRAEKDLISPKEDELVFELVLDVSPAVGRRACRYFTRWWLESAPNRFAALLQFLSRYAKDEKELGHVTVFVRNALLEEGDVPGDPTTSSESP